MAALLSALRHRSLLAAPIFALLSLAWVSTTELGDEYTGDASAIQRRCMEAGTLLPYDGFGLDGFELKLRVAAKCTDGCNVQARVQERLKRAQAGSISLCVRIRRT